MEIQLLQRLSTSEQITHSLKLSTKLSPVPSSLSVVLQGEHSSNHGHGSGGHLSPLASSSPLHAAIRRGSGDANGGEWSSRKN